MITVDFTAWMVHQLDKEATRIVLPGNPLSKCGYPKRSAIKPPDNKLLVSFDANKKSAWGGEVALQAL